VDDQSVIDKDQTIAARSSTKTPQQMADAWLRGMANEQEEVQELVIKDLLGQEDFQGA